MIRLNRPVQAPRIQRILQRIHVEPAADHLGEVVEADALFAAQAADQERHQRQHNQHDQAKDGTAHHEMLEPEPRARTRDPNRAADGLN
jgi:hypothetical protein